MITGKAAVAIILPRIYTRAVMLPIQVVTIQVLWKYIGSHIFSTSYAK
jgi:hypothetical protein